MATINFLATALPGGATYQKRWNDGTWVDFAGSESQIDGTLTGLSAGQGIFEIRAKNDTAVIRQIANVLVGDIFIIAGQSNASGRGLNLQSYSHATLKAAGYKSDTWQELADPVGYDSSAGQGSPWPLVATSFLADQGVPCGFISVSQGGTTISQWQKLGTYYTRLSDTIAAIGGNIKAVLFHLGESDAIATTSEATFNSGLDSLANDIYSDFGVPTVVSKIHDIQENGDNTNVNAAIATAWGDNANVLAGPDIGSYTTSVDTLHFKTDDELADLAGYWWSAIETAFY